MSFQKNNLSDEDKYTFDRKNENVMEKMEELEIITRKIQRFIGSSDPSSDIFTKAFELFSHSQLYADKVCDFRSLPYH